VCLKQNIQAAQRKNLILNTNIQATKNIHALNTITHELKKLINNRSSMWTQTDKLAIRQEVKKIIELMYTQVSNTELGLHCSTNKTHYISHPLRAKDLHYTLLFKSDKWPIPMLVGMVVFSEMKILTLIASGIIFQYQW
jgi:hypothetical protein